MRRNGNGGKGGNGNGGSVPRWVRTLFDQHEARMAAHEARMAAHEARMEELERFMRTAQREEIETRTQTREIVAEIARLDARREKEGKALVEALQDLGGRVSRLERK